ncbi:ATP-binding protein [Poseidonibacter lekithochrous]|uniref:ATP-binding protein n=1 Tax=Poseidonibacter lekithochrous TaxID=1904463 RepID=UPI000D3CB20D|nr:ATP-binding protein [Poseidonibacter lekithochrous]
MIKSKSLKKQILQQLIIFSLVVIVIVGLLSMYNLYTSKLKIIQHNQEQVLSQVEHEVNKFLLDVSNITEFIAMNYEFDQYILKNIVRTNASISSILILDKDGEIEDFYALSNLNIYKGFDYSNKKYFKNLRESKNKDYWSSIFLSTVDEEPSLSYSYRYKNKTIVMMIRLKEISQFITRFRNYDSSHMVRILDNEGIMILNPDSSELVLQRFNATSSEIYTKLINHQKSYSQINYKSIKNKTNEYGMYSTIKKTNWKIVVRENYQEILDELNEMILGIVLFILIFIIFSIFFSLRISKKLFKSIDDLQRITKSISDGKYDAKLEKTYYKEFNHLLKSFNKMQVKIDKREEKLESSLKSFKSLFNSTMEIIILHKDGICVDVNKVAVNFLGYKTKKDLIDKKLSFLIGDKYTEKTKINGNRISEFQITTEDKRNYICIGKTQSILINKEEFSLLTFIDISELKQKDKLLFQQSKMASMGEMIGNIAHQWRQPLSIITTCASGVKFEKEFSTLSDEKLVSSMDLIVNNTKYLSSTIDDFRNFFKKDKTVVEFNLSNYINKAIHLMIPSLKNGDIHIETILDDELNVDGFPNEFLQVLINIFNNSKDAFDMSTKEDKTIHVISYKKNNQCIIEIKDNAGGIPLQIIENIFDPYFTTKHQSKGTGIGLYMSHQIISKHMNGKISVKNNFNKKTNTIYGCTFVITLPIYQSSYLGDYSI